MSENAIAETAETLMLPANATTFVSRSEIVNLLVVEYIERTRVQIVEAEAHAEQLRELCGPLWRAAYEAWYALIWSRVWHRLNPWRDAVSAALGIPMTDLHSDALPRPDDCTYDTRIAVTSSLHRLDALLFNGGTGNRTRKIRVGDQDVTLDAFPMTWSFVGLGTQGHGMDYHSLLIDVDITPDPGVEMQLQAAIAATTAYNNAYQIAPRMTAEIADANIRSLERRALAKLTMQSLGDARRPVL